HERCYFGERLFGAEFKDPLGLPARVALAWHDPVGRHAEVARAARADQLWNAQVQPYFFARDGEILYFARVVLVDDGCRLLADRTRCSLGIKVSMDDDALLGRLDSRHIEAGQGQQVLVKLSFIHRLKLRSPHDLSKNQNMKRAYDRRATR